MSAVVVCLGGTVVDRIYRIPRMPVTASKHFATDARDEVGGIAAVAAAAVAGLGGEARLIARVGDDAAGAFARDRLAAAGVDCRYVETRSGATATSAVLIDDAGERMIVNHADDAIFDGPPDLTALDGAGALLCDLRWPEGAAAAFADAARRGVPTVLDFDRAPKPEAAGLLPAAAIIIFGSEALRDLTGEADPAHGLTRAAAMDAPARLAVTTGAGGVFWRDGNAEGRIPAHDVEAVDTLGAGDVFHGAAALALAEGMDFPRALAFANAAAAVRVTRRSGPGALPTREEANRMMETAR